MLSFINWAIENANMLKFIVSNKCIRQVVKKGQKKEKKRRRRWNETRILSNHSINFVRVVFDVKIALIFSKSSSACISFDIVLVQLGLSGALSNSVFLCCLKSVARIWLLSYVYHIKYVFAKCEYECHILFGKSHN